MTETRKSGDSRLDLIREPLDYLILDILPVEGTLIFGAYSDGKTSAEISKLVGDGTIPTTLIGNRVRVLHELGLVIRLLGLGTSGRNIYQRTQFGTELLAKWKGDQNVTN